MYNLGSYEEVPQEVKDKIRLDVKKMKYKVKLITRWSNHPADNYLYLVMGQGGYKNGYCTWLYNASVGGLCEGHYDMTYKEALLDFGSRLVEV